MGFVVAWKWVQTFGFAAVASTVGEGGDVAPAACHRTQYQRAGVLEADAQAGRPTSARCAPRTFCVTSISASLRRSGRTMRGIACCDGISSMGIKVALEHRTSYTFDRLVEVYPHVVRLRPAPHSRTPIEAYSLQVEPGDHFINWQQDAFGNFLARLVFPTARAA